MAVDRRLGQAKGARGTRVGIMQIVHFGASGKAAASTSRPVDALRALARVTPADPGVAGETEFGMRRGSSVAKDLCNRSRTGRGRRR